jgi:hypothetical protein
MADYGLKIMKAGKDTSSTNIDDHVFWSKYPTLVFLEKKTVSITVTANTAPFSGTTSVSHSYNFFPLVLGYSAKTSGLPSDFNGQKYIMPSNQFAGISCPIFFDQILSFTYKIFDDSVDIIWEASCTDGVDTVAPNVTTTFEIYLYFYMFRLGA